MNSRPFELQVGGTLDPSKHLYIERRDVENEVYQLLVQGEYCNILCPRQVGKSSLMINTALRLQAEGTRVVVMDVAGELGRPSDLMVWYKGFLEKLINILKISVDINNWWEKNKQGTANQRLLQFFRDYVCADNLASCVIFLDEIDTTLTLDYTDDLFTAIRTMFNERPIEPSYKKITFCLIGVASHNELIKNTRTTAYNVGRTIELRDFDMVIDNLNPLIEIVADDPKIGKVMVSKVLSWTDGHPYLTLKLCQEIIDQGIKTPEDLDQFIQSKFSNFDRVRSDVHFQQIERFLGTRISEKLTTLRIYERITSGQKVRDETALSYIQLKLSGLVKRDEHGFLVVRNLIYKNIFDAKWVQNTKPHRTMQYLRWFAITTSFLLILITAIFFYRQLVIEPPQRLARFLENEIRTALDERKAYESYEYLSGIREHFSLQQNPLIEI